MADLDKKGFFMTADGIKSTDLPIDVKKKWGKDVVMPKNPKSAYNCYCAENNAAIKEREQCTPA